MFKKAATAIIAFHPDYPYGFLVTASVCENSPYLEDSREMLEGFRY